MKRVLAFVPLILLALSPVPAAATSITFDLDFEFSGGTTPSGVPSVTIDDFGGSGVVQVSITSNLSGTEFIDDLYLNFSGNPNLLSPTFVSGVQANNVLFGSNAFKADGDGFYDILLDYPPPGSPKFGAGATSVYLFTLAGITANDFNLESLCSQGCGNGSFFAAAHVQSIGPNGSGSGWVGSQGSIQLIPEPASLLLMGSGLFAATARVRRRLRKNT